MIRQPLLLIVAVLLLLPCAHAGPRDAAAVLNRCGKPLKGDTTILENTAAGGRRMLDYERGTLHFDKVANVGWTFTYGTHKRLDHLDAEQMAKYLPCLKDALAESAGPDPLVILTPVQRVEVSMKESFKTLFLYVFAFLAVLGAGLWLYSRRQHQTEEEV